MLKWAHVLFKVISLKTSVQLVGCHFSNVTHLFSTEYSSPFHETTTLPQIYRQQADPNKHTAALSCTPKGSAYRMTDTLSKLAHVSFVWELKHEDSWGISDSNLFLRQYAPTTCMSQMIIYSRLSAQNVWINSCECFRLHEVQESTCTLSVHELEMTDSEMSIMFFIFIFPWSNYR